MSGSWVLHAAASAFFAGLTALLAKIGVSQVPSSVATLVRTVVVVVFAAGITGASGQLHHLRSITGRGWLALIASGIATGLSWLFYFAALKQGPISGVAPIDKRRDLSPNVSESYVLNLKGWSRDRATFEKCPLTSARRSAYHQSEAI
jgi:transporter family protein